MMGWTGDLWWKKRIYMARIKAKERATKLNIPFDIDSADLVRLYEDSGGTCALSLIPFRQTTNPGRADIMSISIDRVRPEHGYVRGNVRLVLHGLNALKGMGTDEELTEICKAVAKANE